MRVAAFGALVALVPSLGIAQIERTPPTPSGPDSLLLATRCEARDGSERCILWFPSLVELIPRHEAYPGRRVRVLGFTNLEFEGNAIFLSFEVWMHGVVSDSLSVAAPPGSQGASGPASRQH